MLSCAHDAALTALLATLTLSIKTHSPSSPALPLFAQDFTRPFFQIYQEMKTLLRWACYAAEDSRPPDSENDEPELLLDSEADRVRPEPVRRSRP